MAERSGREPIPLARPVLGEREEELVVEVLRSGTLSLGPMLERFERAFAAELGVTDAVAVANGTTALHLGVRGLGWGSGEEVVTTPLSFIASSNCLLYEDVRPVFCDVDPRTLCIDPAAAESAVGERTVGLLPVHIFGHPAAMEELEALAAGRGLGLLEDCAQALGAVCADCRPAGARGNPAAFAFYANKQLTTGEGGMLIPGDEDLAARARSERNQGRAPTMKVMEHDRLGFNYRLTDLGAAIGVAQLERLATMLERRRALAATYTELLEAVGAVAPEEGTAEEELLLPAPDRGQARRSPFVFVVQLPTRADRGAVIDELAAAGIDARPYLPCIHLSPLYRERFSHREGEFPVAEAFSRRALALPFFPGLESAAAERVVATLAAALGRRAPRG